MRITLLLQDVITDVYCAIFLNYTESMRFRLKTVQQMIEILLMYMLEDSDASTVSMINMNNGRPPALVSFLKTLRGIEFTRNKLVSNIDLNCIRR